MDTFFAFGHLEQKASQWWTAPGLNPHGDWFETLLPNQIWLAGLFIKGHCRRNTGGRECWGLIWGRKHLKTKLCWLGFDVHVDWCWCMIQLLHGWWITLHTYLLTFFMLPFLCMSDFIESNSVFELESQLYLQNNSVWSNRSPVFFFFLISHAI